ncbi:MAG: hypothetical protein QS748_00595 [Candidatus Endonucleobacter bathymodioli]|uniref:Fungal lipase-like domain-containing protein n=1 Tax=Candidatus Endonucleibacter bathymodioli TaxID=539814 RepID=A0AA90SRY8_9GAMM|nr:hypothetical protein [Candidatus Endonucleobacter bathymodioli]
MTKISSGAIQPKIFQTDSLKVGDPSTKKTSLSKTLKAIFSKGSAHFPQPKNSYSLIRTPPQETPKLSIMPTKPTYFQERSADDITQKDRETLALDANIAAYPYHQNIEKLTVGANKKESWDLARNLALDAGKGADLSTKGSKGFIYDKKSGLTAYILHNPKSKEVRLVFGGTSSGKHTGGIIRRSVLNGAFSLPQWLGNYKNAISNKIPKSYVQAKKLTNIVKAKMESDPNYQGYTLKLSGHSKGAGEAAYAALSQDKPLQALCFSSAQLGSKMREDISDTNKEKAPECISHYAIQGDIVPNMDVLRKHLGHLGTLTTIPAKSPLDGPLDRHDKFHQHISSFAGLK